MSHAASLLAIIERERARKERRDRKYAVLHALIRRARQLELRSAALIEQSEELMGYVR